MINEVYLPDEQAHLVPNQKEIVRILKDLKKTKEDIKISLNQGDDECLTRIIEIDEKNNAVYFDLGRDDAFNLRLLTSYRQLFLKDSGVRVKWASEGISIAMLQDGKALKIAIPTSLVYLQRRDCFRLPTPMAKPVLCKVPLQDEHGNDRMLPLMLVNVSLGGVGALMPDPLDAAFMVDAVFQYCKINFPEVGEASLTLQIKNITPVEMKDGSVKYRIGFNYLAPSRGDEGLINRYTVHLERLAIALANGAK